MKAINLFLVALFILVSVNVFADEGEKEKIKSVIEMEGKAYMTKDFEAYANCWSNEPYVCSTMLGAFGMSVTKSWDSIADRVKKLFQNDDFPGFEGEDSDLDINVIGDMAIVYKTRNVKTTFLGEKMEYTIKATQILTKIAGEWKIVSYTGINESSYEANDFIAEWHINMAGYKLLSIEKVDKAIEVFKLNTELNPQSSNTWDSLAEAYMEKGDNELAIKYYQKSLELNENNTNAKAMIEKMQKGE